MPTKKTLGDVGLLSGDWQQRLAYLVDTMREMSLQTDAHEMVRSYGSRVRKLLPAARWLSLSRRGLDEPWYRITRSSTWTDAIDPWKQKDRLPLFKGGFLADLIYGDEPRLIDDITPLLAADDPAFDYLSGFRSLMAAPHFDQGVALNMVDHLAAGGSRLRPSEGPRVGLGQQPVRSGDAQPRPEERVEGGLRDRRARAQGRGRHPAVALAPGLAQDPDPRAGGLLPHLALGRRRLLRFLPAARWAAGDA